MKYRVLQLIVGSSSAHKVHECATLKEARSVAYRFANDARPEWLTARPVWCEGNAWFEHPDAPDRKPVGGYDVDDTGSAAVIFQ